MKRTTLLLFSTLFFWSCSPTANTAVNINSAYDVVVRNGTVYDGSGSEGFIADVAISGDRIAKIGPKLSGKGKKEIDATGMAITPGFINMLSWAFNSLLRDGLSQSDIRQGVTLEVFGEGNSPGPLSDAMKSEMLGWNSGDDSEIPWVTLGEALTHLENKGVSTNVASFVGATTVRIHVVGYENRKATPEEISEMQALVREAMEEGAVGLGSSLIYAPADYADTDELISLSKVVGEYGGRYISHMRSEDKDLLKAYGELERIAREAGVGAEIYHLKASREPYWKLLDDLIDLVDKAREDGLDISADMYTYNASSTGLTGVIPTWVQEGGHEAWMARMQDPVVRPRLMKDLEAELVVQPPEGILLVGFRNEKMGEKYVGMTLAEAAEERGQAPADAIIDMVVEDDSRIQCVYFSMSEDNIRKKIALPWVAFCSDAGSVDPSWSTGMKHPRAYGSFIRVLGKYARDEGVITVGEGVRRLTSFPADNLKLKNRGRLKAGYYADVVVFDPETIQDHATFREPNQYSTGVAHVFVNGEHVLKEGEHTGATPGRFLKGPGYKDNP